MLLQIPGRILVRLDNFFFPSNPFFSLVYLRVNAENSCQEPFDWCNVSKKQLTDLGGGGLLAQHGRLFNVLSFAFPEIAWVSHNFWCKNKKSTQRYFRHVNQLIPRLLIRQLKRMFPGQNMKENFLHPLLEWGEISYPFYKNIFSTPKKDGA